ncbi:protein draper-like [Mytilus trossulus]|uniref:protein draper-like n=1 Tax=Mytilus trossulus TaxID=6551 RepID=UPI00300755D3
MLLDVEGVDYGAACTGSGTGDCTDKTNTMCETTCKCTAGSFRKGGTECATRLALKATCVITETSPDQCVADTECKDDGNGAKKCLCKASHYESSSACKPRIVPGVSCAAGQCVTHATCNTTSNKCKCDASFTATPTTCSGVIKVATLSYVLVVPIFDLTARFVGICLVFVVYIAAGVEGAAYGEDCSSAACDDTNNICDTGKTDLCICNTGFFRKTSAAECAARVALNQNCEAAQTSSDQCSIALSECRDDSGTDKCLCETTYYEDGGACVLQKALNSACTNGLPAGQCKDTLAECKDNSGFKCLCKTGNFEKKDGTCAKQIAALNDTCVVSEPAPDQCAVDNAECRTDGTAKCQCKVTHYVNVAACTIRKSPKVSCGSGECVAHASCDTDTSKCVCDAGYDPSPTISPTMCSGVVKIITQPYMYLVPSLVSMLLLLR